ncbi:MAG: BMC domain-containing protein [Tissierellia bacterium]|nr:BMC domain-containing protein [Tissierellia bacterium]
MIRAIGVLESSGIAKGIQACDEMLKTGAVTVVLSNSTCPGKHMTVVTGNVSDVEASMAMGQEILGHYYVDHLVLANVEEGVVHGLMGIPSPREIEAIGILEYFSMTGAVYGADAALKAADVDIVQMKMGFALGGKSYLVLTGKVGAIKSAIQAGLMVSKEHGLIFDSTIIPSPHEDLIRQLG